MQNCQNSPAPLSPLHRSLNFPPHPPHFHLIFVRASHSSTSDRDWSKDRWCSSLDDPPRPPRPFPLPSGFCPPPPFADLKPLAALPFPSAPFPFSQAIISHDRPIDRPATGNRNADLVNHAVEIIRGITPGPPPHSSSLASLLESRGKRTSANVETLYWNVSTFIFIFISTPALVSRFDRVCRDIHIIDVKLSSIDDRVSKIENGIPRFLWKWNVVEPLVVAVKILLSRCSIDFTFLDRYDGRYLESPSIEIRILIIRYWKIDVTFRFYICLIDRITSTVEKFLLHLLSIIHIKNANYSFFFPRNSYTRVIDQCLSRKKDPRSRKIRNFPLVERENKYSRMKQRGIENANRYELTARLILPGRLSSVSINSKFTILPAAGLITIRIIARQ